MSEFDLVQRSKARMLFDHVFFSTLIMGTPLRYMTPDEERMMIAVNGTATAFTDMREIVVCKSFIEGPEMGTVPRVMFVLAHEMGHIIFKHGLRRQGRNPRKWNIAGDFAINLMLQKDKFEVWSKALVDPAYDGMSTEQIYEQLPDGGGGKGGLCFGGLGHDIREPVSELDDPSEMDAIGEMITQRVAQAAVLARQAGQMSADLERFIGQVLHPPLPWRELLREFLTRVKQSQETWARRNRRFPNVYLPSRHNRVIGPIYMLCDTSGSITNDEIAQIAFEMDDIALNLMPEKIHVLWGDTKVKHEQIFLPGEPIEVKPVGGGGTNMVALLEHVEQFDPEVVVLITDGYSPFPTEEPPFSLIVVCTTNVSIPVGAVVRYE